LEVTTDGCGEWTAGMGLKAERLLAGFCIPRTGVKIAWW
jgi:hypothetical protein